MLKIAEVFGPENVVLWKLVRQCGVKHVVGGISLRPRPGAGPEQQPWSFTSLLRAKTAKLIAFNAAALAKDAGHVRAVNMVMLGAFFPSLGIARFTQRIFIPFNSGYAATISCWPTCSAAGEEGTGS